MAAAVLVQEREAASAKRIVLVTNLCSRVGRWVGLWVGGLPLPGNVLYVWGPSTCAASWVGCAGWAALLGGTADKTVRGGCAPLHQCDTTAPPPTSSSTLPLPLPLRPRRPSPPCRLRMTLMTP